MRPFIPLVITVYIFGLLAGCSNSQEPVADTEPPSVSILAPINNAIVSEIVAIECQATDNEAVKVLQLWIDGDSTSVRDEEAPYIFFWNTTLYPDTSAHEIVVKAWDVNGNIAESEAITLIVDNSLSAPPPLRILSAEIIDVAYKITWTRSLASDFKQYILEKSSDSLMGNPVFIHITTDIGDTSFIDQNADPLTYTYYRVTVQDTLGYQSGSPVFGIPQAPTPSEVNIRYITYNQAEMKVVWTASGDQHFSKYKLLYAESETGIRDTVAIFTNNTDTIYTTQTFNPAHENWYWVEVVDRFGQSVIGDGASNELEQPPAAVAIRSIGFYDNAFHIEWDQSADTDFAAYTIYESFAPDMNLATVVYSGSNPENYNYIHGGIPYDEYRYYRVDVTDVWGLTATGAIHRGSSYPLIFFLSIVNGKDTVFQMDNDGMNITQLTSGQYSETQLTCSPDGRTLVYTSVRDGLTELYALDLKNRTENRLTNNNLRESSPRFSPDGGTILFVGIIGQENDFYTMDKNGGGITNLTNSTWNEFNPSFSPDGSKVVYIINSRNEAGISLINIDGNGYTRLTYVNGDDDPVFTPDGQKIVYSDDDHRDIYIMNLDGSGKINLTSGSQNWDRTPRLSRDGIKIAFLSNRNTLDNELFIMNADGSNEQRLTFLNQQVRYHQFMDDGNTIVFQQAYPPSEIYRINSDGSNLVNLTNNSVYEYEIVVQPRL